jgi:hypothetical protein
LGCVCSGRGRRPSDHFGWFTLGIGPAGERGADLFQVCISTPEAIGRASKGRSKFRGLVVESFKPEEIRQKLRDYISSLQGLTWAEDLNQLRQVMRWEYEGMGGA